MLSSLSNKISNRLRTYKNYLDRVRKIRYKSSLSTSNGYEKSVYFDLSHNVFEQYLYTFVYHFVECGYEVYINARPSFLGKLGEAEPWSLYLLDTHHVWFTQHPPKSANICFCLEVNTYQPPGYIPMSYNYFASGFTDNFGFYVPMSFSPDTYHTGAFRQAQNLRHRANRRLKIIFAGSTDKKFYGSSSPFLPGSPVETVFDKIPRYKVFRYLVDHLPPDALLQPTSLEELNSQASSNKVVLISSSYFRLSLSEMFHAFLNSSFFLALPGVIMPPCYNIVEAMSVGCIPILEYPEYFPKPLKHGENCLVFDGLDDLLIQIKCALEMSETQISAMRHKVIEYYEQCLSSQAIVSQLEKRSGEIKRLYLNAEWRSVAVMMAESKVV